MDMRYHPGDEEYTSPDVFHRPAFTSCREHGGQSPSVFAPHALAADLSFRGEHRAIARAVLIAAVSSPTDAAPLHRSAIRRRRSALPAADWTGVMQLPPEERALAAAGAAARE